MLTILHTSGAVTCPKYDIGDRRAAASIISAISGWVRAAKDIIVPYNKYQDDTQFTSQCSDPRREEKGSKAKKNA